jgi:hypothetical protein
MQAHYERHRNNRRTERRRDAYTRERRDASADWRAEYRNQGAPLPDDRAVTDGGERQ